MVDPSRPLVWIGRSEKDFFRFPKRVRSAFLIGLDSARSGEREISGAKPLTQGILKGLGVIELVEDFEGDTYRVVFTVRLTEVLAVLHAFKKKSKTGIATPRHEIRLIRVRYREAVRVHSRAAHRKRR